jgi:hypothetical protein
MINVEAIAVAMTRHPNTPNITIRSGINGAALFTTRSKIQSTMQVVVAQLGKAAR